MSKIISASSDSNSIINNGGKQKYCFHTHDELGIYHMNNHRIAYCMTHVALFNWTNSNKY